MTHSSSGSLRPRRSHALGACSTCRRRHVRCDQKRPACRSCRTLGLRCEGFPGKVRWMRSSGVGEDGAEDIHHGTRRHLYTERSRLSMSNSLGADLVSGSIDASLAEIDLRSRDPTRSSESEIVVGPFSVLDFTPSRLSGDRVSARPAAQEVNQESPVTPMPLAAPIPPGGTGVSDTSTSGPAPSMLESLEYMDDFLRWSDILGFSPDQLGSSLQPPFDVGLSGYGDSWDLTSETMFGSGLLVMSDHIQNSSQGPISSHNAVGVGSEQLDILADVPFLLKHFQDIVLPKMVAMPLGQKSPWKTLNIPGAMATFGDLTILETQDISLARLANLYAILACSATYLALNPSSCLERSVDHWQSVAGQAFEEAKGHMKMSLKNETEEPKKAKYKDQLMALCALIEYAVISGQQNYARCFMVDAERLLRLRGLSKHRIPQKARLLHHVYTWLRIVGESTYVLHDYSPSSSFLESLESNFRLRRPGDNATATSEWNTRLDDFLRLESRNPDCDLNINEPKDRETGFYDIHLQDSRSFPETLYKQTYGIPETWLSLVSQTTRLANVMESFRIAQKSYKGINVEAWETLHRRSVLLENMICSFSLGRSRDGKIEDTDTSTAARHMIHALSAALVIFFYRRIRQVHPVVLGGEVDKVISALNHFNTAMPHESLTGPGTAWPAFIAGCEAITDSQREEFMQWLNEADSKCGFAAFRTAKGIMAELWRKQDQHLATDRGEPVPTWIDITRQAQLWPMLC
ncbi:Zn(II)2Cys6 transcription factor [Aspergillus candidus]|uniref:Fungal-specific transcription factor domain-domain-containing protein n=1 Tax=Aspergillus candidus TaxID=41067 RepID=A0A2I2FNG2_ASPCN|nr:fungal-specific transcription factor domain-domain-containing protein [Aspergillus candidus]PLB42154.1 fungal-specific transcription factor domain-domain-containing protein [Aspergillus candidus]